MLDNAGQDGTPHRANTVINDMSTALYTFQAVAPLLYAKHDGAPGRYFDISLMRGAACLHAIRIMAATRGELSLVARTAPSGIFRSPAHGIAGIPLILNVKSVPGPTRRTSLAFVMRLASGFIALAIRR